jgi:hypothetical protein
MEIYSTVLWFLKREHELCYLAQVSIQMAMEIEMETYTDT